tara:strand:+ start:854 stop:1042 length:189 start_codon:yes stop_codon:yes gene_type:complete
MKCQACDKRLGDFEATRKDLTTGEYLDLCNNCYSVSKNDVSEREDLRHVDSEVESYDDEDSF